VFVRDGVELVVFVVCLVQSCRAFPLAVQGSRLTLVAAGDEGGGAGSGSGSGPGPGLDVHSPPASPSVGRSFKKHKGLFELCSWLIVHASHVPKVPEAHSAQHSSQSAAGTPPATKSLWGRHTPTATALAFPTAHGEKEEDEDDSGDDNSGDEVGDEEDAAAW